ncbi:hypothetical protein NQZ68_015962, partial [Dissostichus eleginoides]
KTVLETANDPFDDWTLQLPVEPSLPQDWLPADSGSWPSLFSLTLPGRLFTKLHYCCQSQFWPHLFGLIGHDDAQSAR